MLWASRLLIVMTDTSPQAEPLPAEEFVRVESIFVRGRNCLLLTADFSAIYVDYYLHLMSLAEKHAELEDGIFKSVLAYFTLHLVSRPWAEQHAWTFNLCEPLEANIFVSGSSHDESVIGRLFLKDVRVPEQNTLYSQVLRPKHPLQTSAVTLPGATPEAWLEGYYRQSEQRQARAFYLGGDRYALITAEPSADADWLDALTAPEVQAMIDKEGQEETKLLESRRFQFRCSCTVEKVLPTLRAMRDQVADLVARDGFIEVACPRCGKKFIVTPEMLEALPPAAAE